MKKFIFGILLMALAFFASAASLPPGVMFQYDSNGQPAGYRTPTGVLPLNERSNTLAIVGNSIEAHWLADTATTHDMYGGGYVSWALGLSGQRMIVVSSPATSATFVTDNGPHPWYSEQMTTAIASGAKHVIIGGAANDFESASPLVTVAQVQAQYRVLISRALGAGMKVWLVQPPPIGATAYTLLRQSQMLYIHNWLQQLASNINVTLNRNAVSVINVYKTVVNPSSATSAMISTYTQGDDHLTNDGGRSAGKELARRWIAEGVPEIEQLPSSHFDAYTITNASGVTSPNILDNPLCITVTGGTTCTGWTVSALSTGTATPTIVARADGYGNDQRIACTFTAANGLDGCRFESNVNMSARIANNDIIIARCEITLEASPTNFRNLRMLLSINSSVTNISSSDMQYDSSKDVAYSEGFTRVYKSRPLQHLSAHGTVSSITLQITGFGGSAGSGAYRVGRCGIEKQISGL